MMIWSRSFLFWGCPSLWSGRAVSGLASLLGPSQNFASARFAWSGLRPPFSIPQPSGLRPSLNARSYSKSVFLEKKEGAHTPF
nr:hypothetical protein [Saprospira grandis]